MILQWILPETNPIGESSRFAGGSLQGIPGQRGAQRRRSPGPGRGTSANAGDAGEGRENHGKIMGKITYTWTFHGIKNGVLPCFTLIVYGIIWNMEIS